MKTYKSTLLSTLPHVHHAFFTRDGGVSEGIYKGLNVGIGSNDVRENVLENRNRVCKHLGAGSELYTLYQIHSPNLVTIDSQTSSSIENRGEGDALFTQEKHKVLGILTADCVPVLFAAKDRSYIAAAHAGWKGACGGVLENCILQMKEQGISEKDIVVAIGPAIQPESYEVDEVFKQRFLSEHAQNDVFFSNGKREGFYQFDLPAYVKQRILKAGIVEENIDLLRVDTYALEMDFFSFRRTTHRNEPDYGRHLSGIMLVD